MSSRFASNSEVDASELQRKWRAQLLCRETNCFEPLRSGFTDLSSILDQGRMMNIPVFYREVNMILWVLFSNV